MKKRALPSPDFTNDSLGISRTTFSKTLIQIKGQTQRDLRDSPDSTQQSPLIQLPELKLQSSQQKIIHSHRQIGDRLIKKKTRTSDFFNVYKAPETLQTNPETLRKQSKIYKQSQYIIQQYYQDLCEIKEIQIDKNINITYEQRVTKYLTDQWLQLEQTIHSLNSLISLKFNRKQCEQQMREMLLDCFKQRNICLQQRMLYIFGKIEQLFYNPIQGAIYYKQCKRLSDTPQHFENKMKAYRGLGECLLKLYPKLSQLYFTKYLVAAWKLQSRQDELMAYELLGKYYFYMGQLEKAKMYHERMVNGVYEDENSRVRLLALSRLEQTNIARAQKDQQIVVDIEHVSSDDECYELVFQSKPAPKQQYYVEKYFKKKLPDLQLVKDQGNQNIRQTQIRYNSQDNISIVSNPHLNIGDIKDKILITHMTPNRKLETYQYLALANDKNGYLNSPRFEGLYNKFEGQKFTKIINRTVQQLNNVQQWLTQQEKIKSETQIRRKGYFVV